MKKKPTLIIAEIGINHNGDVHIAKELARIARQAGCDAVKFQKRDIDTVYSKDVQNIPRESPYGTNTGDQKRGIEFTREAYDEINLYCRSISMPWFASCWDIKSLEFMDKYVTPLQKIASPYSRF